MVIRRRLLLTILFHLVQFSTTGYDKIEWQNMDSDQDGSVSPDEMKQHYKDEGVTNSNKRFVKSFSNFRLIIISAVASLRLPFP
ncbi:MAG: hypothetical protein CM15mP58_13740 [Burkholderiaceae bacterium]|nr:MAG: hypothetical protein CM15mP58_13740 [Burkholderiaceae bacterium]